MLVERILFCCRTYLHDLDDVPREQAIPSSRRSLFRVGEYPLGRRARQHAVERPDVHPGPTAIVKETRENRKPIENRFSLGLGRGLGPAGAAENPSIRNDATRFCRDKWLPWAQNRPEDDTASRSARVCAHTHAPPRQTSTVGGHQLARGSFLSHPWLQ